MLKTANEMRMLYYNFSENKIMLHTLIQNMLASFEEYVKQGHRKFYSDTYDLSDRDIEYIIKALEELGYEVACERVFSEHGKIMFVINIWNITFKGKEGMKWKNGNCFTM